MRIGHDVPFLALPGLLHLGIALTSALLGTSLWCQCFPPHRLRPLPTILPNAGCKNAICLVVFWDDFVPIGFSERQNPSKQANLQDVGDDLCGRRDGLRISENVDEPLHRPLAVFVPAPVWSTKAGQRRRNASENRHSTSQRKSFEEPDKGFAFAAH
jgi:hypothetical protein